MAERRVNVGWAEGLHARPASIFVRAATASGVPMTIAKADGNPVNAASMLAVLGLGAQGGEEIVLASDAEGAEEALDRLAKLVAEGLEELPELSLCIRDRIRSLCLWPGYRYTRSLHAPYALPHEELEFRAARHAQCAMRKN